MHWWCQLAKAHNCGISVACFMAYIKFMSFSCCKIISCMVLKNVTSICWPYFPLTKFLKCPTQTTCHDIICSTNSLCMLPTWRAMYHPILWKLTIPTKCPQMSNTNHMSWYHCSTNSLCMLPMWRVAYHQILWKLMIPIKMCYFLIIILLHVIWAQDLRLVELLKVAIVLYHYSSN